MEVSSIRKSVAERRIARDAEIADAIKNFEPLYAECEIHGQWERNSIDETGRESIFNGCQKCGRLEYLAGQYKRAGIPPRFKEKTVENYVCANAGQTEAKRIANAYVTDLQKVITDGSCLIFCGKPGSGKTHLAIGILREAIGKNYKGRFMGVTEAIREFRASWRDSSQKTEQQVMEEYASFDLLLIDEVGVQYGTEAEQLVLFEIINRRYMDVKPTIVISNLPAGKKVQGDKTIQEYLGERAFDRLRENGGRLVIFDWESYRKQA